MAKLLDIENELTSLLQKEKKNWVSVYRLLKEVETSGEWQDEYHSFTAWVNHLADISNCHVSLIWSRKNQGEFYSKYEERCQAAGKSYTPMEQVSVSPDNFTLIEKVAQGNEEVADDLIEKTLSGNMKRADLKTAWKTVKANKASRGLSAARKNNYTPFVVEDKKDLDTAVNSAVTAKDIMDALNASKTWLFNNDPELERAADKKLGRRKKIYKVLPEFAVRTGDTYNPRRIDALIIENYSVDKMPELNFVGIEIKVSKNDLLEDKKMEEYADFVNQLYLCVPEELESLARERAENRLGVLVYSDGVIKEVHPANQGSPLAITETYLQSIIYLI